MLGEQGHFTYWGEWVLSRSDVRPGTQGSAEFCRVRQEDD